MLSDEQIGFLWNYVNRGTEFPWPKSTRAQIKLSSSLSALLGESQINDELNGLNKTEFNFKLRKLISPKLRNGNVLKATELAKWIVRDWGGIKNGNEAIGGWMERLADFNQKNISIFVDDMQTKRISSWSKILAFSDPFNHAIYDARTAISLNCGLSELGIEWRFSMPLSQNKGMTAVRPLLLPEDRNNERGYPIYLDLLKLISKHIGKDSDILTIEMTLFANAPLIAERYVLGS